jgi:hypothetical protein
MLHNYNALQKRKYHIAGKFRMVLIFVYFIIIIIMLHPLYENKNYENFFSARDLDLWHTQSLALLQMLTMSLYRFFAKDSNSSPTAAAQILL